MSTRINGTTGIDKVQPGIITQDDLANGLSGRPPIFKAEANASVNCTSGAEQKALFTNVIGDSHGYYDSSLSRFKPLIAGWYMVSAELRLVAVSSFAVAQIRLFMNSAFYKQGGTIQAALTANVPQHVGINELVYFNGVSDYAEIVGLVSGTTPSIQFSSSTQTSRFSAFLVRADV